MMKEISENNATHNCLKKNKLHRNKSSQGYKKTVLGKY